MIVVTKARAVELELRVSPEDLAQVALVDLSEELEQPDYQEEMA